MMIIWGMDDYQPRDPDRRRAWARLSPLVQQARLDKARRQRKAIEDVRARPEGETERDAIARVVTWTHRSSYRRWQAAFDADEGVGPDAERGLQSLAPIATSMVRVRNTADAELMVPVINLDDEDRCPQRAG